MQDVTQRARKYFKFLVEGTVDGECERSLSLARAIRKGTLAEHPALLALVSLVLKKADRMNRGCKKLCTASARECSEDSLEELGFALGLHASRASVLQFIGADSRRVAVIHMYNAELPVFYSPTMSPGPCLAESCSQLQINIQKALDILEVRGTRRYAAHIQNSDDILIWLVNI